MLRLQKIYQLTVITLLISLASMSSEVLALESHSKVPQHIKNKQTNIRQETVKEAADAFKATETALKALNNHQPKQALSALQVASGNLHLLLARDPSLDLVPVDIQVQFIEGVHDLNTIKKLEDQLGDLISDGHYQTARPIVDSLVDEMRKTTVSLPLSTYPTAIDKVAPLIDQGKIDEAKQMLIDILDTFEISEEVTPLTVIYANEKLSEAFLIEHTEDLSKQETKNKIETLVNQAEQDIKIAEALGYGVKDNYSGIYEAIHALKKAIGETGFKGEWLKLKKALAHFENRIVHPRG